ncbi:MAG: hypothetical protein EPN70_21800 [Paraburkholderia sp.]|nr:MAG: hypothetical protein EPN70_21800 [Paraburkholderia sp.]
MSDPLGANMTLGDAIFRAGALAVVLYAMNHLRKGRGVMDNAPKPKNVTTQRVAGVLTGFFILGVSVYFLRHQIAATFHIP